MTSIPIHDTAFIIAYYRSQHEDISLDPYAKLWLRPSLTSFASDFSLHVSAYDGLLHCFRNRYFLESLTQLTSEGDWLFINIGAGFSMYPYLLSDRVTTLEIDLPEIVSFKKEAIKKFTSEGFLPHRNVSHSAADITNKRELEELTNTIKTNYIGLQTVVLIEGVFFFLNRNVIDDLLRYIADFQKAGDVTMCVSFEDSSTSQEVFERLKNYFIEHLNSKNNPFTTLPNTYYTSLSKYVLKKSSSSFQVGKEIKSLPPTLRESDVLNEFFYTLHRC